METKLKIEYLAINNEYFRTGIIFITQLSILNGEPCAKTSLGCYSIYRRASIHSFHILDFAPYTHTVHEE